MKFFDQSSLSFIMIICSITITEIFSYTIFDFVKPNRDLKPKNIGLDDQGLVKMFDFGLAKELKTGFQVGVDKAEKLAADETQAETQENMAQDDYNMIAKGCNQSITPPEDEGLAM
eukprot:scaffold3835_cov295-Chaetoceros_neogracile.AAC.7